MTILIIQSEHLFLSYKTRGFSGGSVVKEFTCHAGNAGDLGSTPRQRRSPGGGYGNPLWYSFLENPLD